MVLKKKNIHENISIDINAGILSAAFSIAAKNDWRFYLNAVQITSAKYGGVNIVGCDAQRLIYLWDPTGYCSSDEEIILPRDELKELIKYSRMSENRNKTIKIRSSGDGVELEAALKNKKYKFLPEGVEYPPISAVTIEASTKCRADQSVLYSAKYLTDFKFLFPTRRIKADEQVGIHISPEGHFLAASKYGFYITMPKCAGDGNSNMLNFIFNIVKKPENDILLRAVDKEKRLEGFKFIKDILGKENAKIVKKPFSP
tara:strand:- start:2171 stop:2944 length:774 start_codon:yes stop_codon:yes gene_type:complete